MSTRTPIEIHHYGLAEDPESEIPLTGSVVTDGSVDMGALEAALDYIRPAIQADGGDIYLQEVREGEVTIRMVGACDGCPLSMMTLRAGIERLLFDMVPGVSSVVAR